MDIKTNKMTAVEWLFQELNDYYNLKSTKSKREMLEQAKEMEKQQIIDAHGIKTKSINQDQSEIKTGRQYYNETFNVEIDGTLP